MSRSKRIFILVALMMVVVLGAVLMALAARQKSANKVTWIEGKAKLETLYLAPKVPGRVEALYVRQGEKIQAGDTLAILDLPDVAARLKQAEGALISARAQFQMAKNGATSFDRRRAQAQRDAAVAQYEFANASYRRVANMFSDSLIAAQEYEHMRSRYESAHAQLEAARAQFEDVESGVRAEKMDMARGDYERAKATLEEVQSAWQERIVTAPSDMRIQTVVLKKGELATPGYHLFAGYLTGAPIIRFTVPESQMSGFATGETYSLVSGFSRDTMEAQLEKIVPLPDYASITSMFPRHTLGETVYEIHFRPMDSHAQSTIQHNMTFLLEFDKASNK